MVPAVYPGLHVRSAQPIMQPMPPIANDTRPALPEAPLHALIPWAASLSDHSQQALAQLDDPARLPHLHRLLSQLSDQSWHRSDEYALNPPHEAVWAQALGWQTTPSGHAPWAAHLAQADGLRVQGEAWGLLTPGHWLMGRDHLTVLHPDQLQLSEDESRALLESVRHLFESEGWSLHWGAPTRWYATHDSLADLPTAALDRVLGRNPDVWMPEHPQARLIRRLQAEVQMLLYLHPINDARSERGALTVNSFWLSGCGRAQPVAPGTRLTVLDGPRQALLRADLPAWLAAWDELDRQTLPALIDALQAGQRVALTLTGERHALTLSSPVSPSWWQRTRQRLRPPQITPSSLLAAL